MARATRVLKGIFLRALGTGKVTIFTVIAALTLFTASTALAANGGNFILGVATNSATAITQLTANIANPALKVVNTSTSTGATGLNLQTATSKPPMTVNSGTKVTNLNADKVDGQEAAAMLPGGDLPSGRTVRGMFSMFGTASSANEMGTSDSISFGYRLASAPTVEFVREGQPSTTQCPGTVTSPEAAKGYLCVYENERYNISSTFYPYVWFKSRTGATLYTFSALSGQYRVDGTWAVTAA